ncbi:unnamed protein product, partial [Ectocarpus sp. 8 AP-2014]
MASKSSESRHDPPRSFGATSCPPCQSSVTHGSLAWKILILSCSFISGYIYSSVSIYLSRFNNQTVMVVPVVES